MSGSGGGRRGGGGGGGGVERTRCEDLFEQTTLNSPNAAVLKALKVDEVLNVQVKPNTGGAGPSVVAVTTKPNPQIAGAITSATAPRLIDCISKKFKYIAVVLEVKGGLCKVEIRPRPKT